MPINRKKITHRMKLLMGTAFLADTRDSFIMKLFHFVCEKRRNDSFQMFDTKLHSMRKVPKREVAKIKTRDN
jgi:hypothetical protein